MELGAAAEVGRGEQTGYIPKVEREDGLDVSCERMKVVRITLGFWPEHQKDRLVAN